MREFLTGSLLVILLAGCQSTRPKQDVFQAAPATAQDAISQSADDLGGPPAETTITVEREDKASAIPVVVNAPTKSESSGEVPINYQESVPVEQVLPALTLEQIESLVISTNPAIAQAQASVEALRGKWTQVGLPPNPTVGIIGDDINEAGSPGRYGVFFGRRIVRGNKLALSRNVVCQEIKVAERRVAEMQQRILTDVRQRFYELLVAQQKMQLTDELAKISEGAVDVSNKLFQAAEVSRSVVLQSELELERAKVAHAQAVNELLGARRKLAALIGESELPADTVEGDPRRILELMDFEQMFDELLSGSPELAALFDQIRRARSNLNRQCVEPIPDLTWQATVQYGIETDDVVTGFQLGMPIPVLNRNQGAIHQAQQEIVTSQRRAEKKALDLRVRLAAAYQSYQESKLQVDAFDQRILPLAKKTLELVSLGYRQGEVDYLQLLTAQRSYFQSNLAYNQELRNLWQQNLRIKGMLLSGGLQ